MFTKAIVKTPGKSLIQGLTSVNLGIPDYKIAISQHQNYITVLKKCGLEVNILEADENYPDSTFVEDTALLTPYCAIITNPGAMSRRGEIIGMKKILSGIFKNIEEIKGFGTVEAGDIMQIGTHYYIGLSERTNKEGANQLLEILSGYGLKGTKIPLKKMLHLKSGVSYLGNNNLLVTRELKNEPEFQKFNLILVDDDESYAANSLWINNNILIPKGFPKTKSKIEMLGYNIIEIDVSEFRKLDGGLSCLSLRF